MPGAKPGAGLGSPRMPVPANSVLPVISGTVTVGQTLSVTNGSWSPTPVSYTYQWKRAGVNISAATAATYELVIADQGAAISCAVTAINTSGSATATSAATAAVAAYDPLALFSGGQGGAWYDPSDLSHMWQDTAGTVPVTADGQSVLRIDDKSGNGLHLTQATSLLAPLYKTDGTLKWLQFNGLTQFMQRASVDLSAYFKVTVFTGLLKASDASQRILLEHGASTGANVGFSFQPPNSAAANIGVGQRGATTQTAASKTTTAAPVTFYGTGIYDLQAPNIQARVNGVSGSAVTTSTGAGNFTTQTLNFGARNGLSSFFSGNVYQLMFAMKTASAAEILNAENHCKVKAGL